MFLSDLRESQTAEIIRIDEKTPFGTRLCDMGFCVGEKVICVKRATFQSPILFNVKGSNIALRKKDAKKIEVVF